KRSATCRHRERSAEPAHVRELLAQSVIRGAAPRRELVAGVHARNEDVQVRVLVTPHEWHGDHQLRKPCAGRNRDAADDERRIRLHPEDEYDGMEGRLVTRRMCELGLRPVLCGRDARKVAAFAGDLDLDHRTAAITDPNALGGALRGVGVVLNAAGPFSRTAEPIADACLRAGAHYL